MDQQRYIEEVNTLISGWVPTGDPEGGVLNTYETIEEACKEVWDLFDEINRQVSEGERMPNEGYSPEDWRIHDSEENTHYTFTYAPNTTTLLVELPDQELRYAETFEPYIKVAPA